MVQPAQCEPAMHIDCEQTEPLHRSLSGGLAEGFVVWAPLLFREPVGRQPGARVEIGDEEQEAQERDPLLVCRSCGLAITREDKRIMTAGAHRHTFFNPAGIVYELGCFSEAGGCVLVGPRSPEFSWFAGCLWQVALCRGCGKHLGWHFLGDGHSFFGLILAELVVAE